MENCTVLSREDLQKAIENSLYTRRVWGNRVWERSGHISKSTNCIKLGDEVYELPGAVTICFYIYYIENNIVKKIAAFPNMTLDYTELTPIIVKKREDFYDIYGKTITNPLYLSCEKDKSEDDWIINSLDKSIGFSPDIIYENAKQYYIDNIRGKGYTNKSEKDRWMKLSDEARRYIISMDRRFVDVFSTGFSVRVLLSSDKSFKDLKAFTREHGREILRYVINEIPYLPNITKRIGDVRFYKPVELTVLRTSELDIKFEVKNVEGLNESAG